MFNQINVLWNNNKNLGQFHSSKAGELDHSKREVSGFRKSILYTYIHFFQMAS